jgi:hypothetical protein
VVDGSPQSAQIARKKTKRKRRKDWGERRWSSTRPFLPPARHSPPAIGLRVGEEVAVHSSFFYYFQQRAVRLTNERLMTPALEKLSMMTYFFLQE